MTGIVTATTTAKRKARRNELWGMLRAGSWRIVVGWSRSGGGHATGLEGTSSAQYSEIHTSGGKKHHQQQHRRQHQQYNNIS